MNRILLITLLAVSALLASCAKEDSMRTEGVTLGVGDSVARNTALQVIDPWPAGVEDTELLIPNERGGKDGSTPATAAPATSANP